MHYLTHFDDLDLPELSPTQGWLLSALISGAPQNREAFKRWTENIDFDSLDHSSSRLVPLLFRQYVDDPLCEPFRGRMKGIFRYHHYRNNLLAAEARKMIEALNAAGVETLLFKGIALALQYHDNLALRPMEDVDVLVHARDVGRAESVLYDLGWKYRYTLSKKERDIHSHDYINSRNFGFDLHWYSLMESPIEHVDDGLWERAEQSDWQGVPVRWMCREDLVLVAMVNGLREREAMRIEWFSDVAKVIRDRPGFNWACLWDEAGNRLLQPVVFEAMLLLNRIAPDLLPTPKLHALFETGGELARHIVQQLVRENRTQAINRSRQAKIDTLLEAPSRPFFTRWLAREQAYKELSNDSTTPKHIMYTTNAQGDIDSLYLHWQYLPVLKILFRVGDEDRLAQLLARYKPDGEGCIPIEPGLLALPENDVLPHYHAQIQLADMPDNLVIPVQGVGQVALNVINDSDQYWVVREHSAALYGVSYHVLSQDGTMVAWDQPRTYFMQSRPKHLAFVAPGQQIACRMKIHAPSQPGRYRLQLDVLQEYVLWFSGQNILFPVLDMDVIL